MARNARKRTPTEAEVLARYQLMEHWANTARWFAMGLILIGAILACYPTAAVLAGRETVLNVSLVASVSIALGVSTAGLGLWGARQKKRAERLEVRNKDLARDVKELQGRLRDNKLPDSVSR